MNFTLRQPLQHVSSQSAVLRKPPVFHQLALQPQVSLQINQEWKEKSYSEGCLKKGLPRQPKWIYTKHLSVLFGCFKIKLLNVLLQQNSNQTFIATLRILPWNTGKQSADAVFQPVVCWQTGSLGGDGGALICSIGQFLGYKHFRCGQFQANTGLIVLLLKFLNL